MISTSRLKTACSILITLVLTSGCTSQTAMEGNISDHAVTQPKVACSYQDKENSLAQVDSTTLYVVSHGWHTGILLDYPVVQQVLPQLAAAFPGARFLEIGWGDANFYQKPDAGAADALQAACCSSGTVMHVVALDHPPELYFSKSSRVVPVGIHGEGMACLGEYLNRHLARSEEGHMIPLGPGLYGRSRFFRATGTFSLAYTCNSWTNEGLQAAGVAMHPTLCRTADCVLEQLPMGETTSKQ
ncbi:MAG: DUF2459 domain-containing protein [Magnetococcales bacterium]|nr:DUF2459 domain-containing protein [Magnetococcales bacterium]NGZ26899.1 DUF2459 domain-containing protein [Magnetococcales bacterium]